MELELPPVETDPISRGSEAVALDELEEERSIGLVFSFAKYFGLKYTVGGGCRGAIVRLYTFSLFSFLGYNMVRTCLMFDLSDGFSDLALLKLINLSHTINSLASCITLVVLQRSHLNKFITLWSSLHLEQRIPGHATLNFFIRLGFLYVIAVSGFDGLITQLGTYNIWFRLPVLPDFFFGRYEFLAGIASFFITLPVTLLHVVFTLVCMILYFEFQRFNYEINEQKDDCDPKEMLPFLRARHFAVTQLTELSDFALSYYTLIIFSINVPGLCAVLYVLMTFQAVTMVSTVQLFMWLAIFR